MRIGEVVDWKIFNRLSILPLFETITRNGAGVCFRLILACCKSSGMPSRTLSRFKLVCPSKTASARARWRNKCSLSSREVKSTGAKFFVVTLPSTVIAKVALTNGRETWEGRLDSFFTALQGSRGNRWLPDEIIATLTTPLQAQ